MTKEEFARAAYFKCGKFVPALGLDQAETEEFEVVFNRALRTAIHDSFAKEFQSPYRPPLKYSRVDPNNPYSNKDSTNPQAPFYIFAGHQDIITYADNEPAQSVGGINFGFSQTFITRGVEYYPFYDRVNDENLIATPSQFLPPIKVLWFKKNLNLWSPKMLEASITYCAHLLAPKVSSDDANMAQKLLREYGLLIGEAKTYDVQPGQYGNPPSAYNPIFGLAEDRGFINFPIGE